MTLPTQKSAIGANDWPAAWPDRWRVVAGIVWVWLASAGVASCVVAAFGLYDQSWRDGLFRDGAGTTAEVRRFLPRDRFRIESHPQPSRRIVIAWRDGAKVRIAEVTLSPGYAAALRGKARATVPIRYRGTSVIVADDAAENTFKRDRVEPALIIAFASFAACLVFRRRRPAPPTQGAVS